MAMEISKCFRLNSLARFDFILRGASNVAVQPVNSTILEHPESGTEVHLIGCAHNNRASINELQDVLQSVKPQKVVIPVCDKRLAALKLGIPTVPNEFYEQLKAGIDEQLPRIPDAARIPGFSGEQVAIVVRSWLRGLGFEPGSVLKQAIQEAEKLDAEVVPAEPPLDATFTAAMEAVKGTSNKEASLSQTVAAAASRAGGALQEFTVSLRQERAVKLTGSGFGELASLELIENRRTARALVQVVRALIPDVAKVLVDARDEEIARVLLKEASVQSSKPLVAVVGIMQLDGVQKQFVDQHMLHAEQPASTPSVSAAPSSWDARSFLNSFGWK